MAEQQITLDGQQIAFRTSGGQDRPVIFLHGNSCSSSTWDGILGGPFGQRPLAILHGQAEQLISLDYLRTLSPPTLWRGQVQVIPGAGHVPHLEAPEAFTAFLQDFVADLS